MNKIILVGNLTRDPELNTTPNGISVCRFAIAVNRDSTGQSGQKETDYFNIVAWRGLGDNCHKFLKKGNKVAVSGSVQIRTYDDKDGYKKTTVEVIADDVEFLTPKAADYDGEEQKEYPIRQPVKPPVKARTLLEPISDDDDLPF